jgi:5'-methylthioadenosine phosphorylase
MTEKIAFAVIGGSGLYDMPGLREPREHDLVTPFGRPSSPIISGTLEGKRVAFIARHGLGHHITPTEVNYRANIYALKSLGVDRIVSISACGSLREDIAPSDIVIPDQVFDHTRLRVPTFFGSGFVGHVSVADPFCPDLSGQMAEAAQRGGAKLHSGGTLITIEGPRFSTRAESDIFRAWGMSIIGMTACPEVFLAREAEICYTTLAHVTDYDVWHVTEAPVTAEMVVATLQRNTERAQETIRLLARDLRPERNCDCRTALEDALLTSPSAIPPATRENLALLVGKYLQ